MFSKLKDLANELPVNLTDAELKTYRNVLKTRKILQAIKVEAQKLRLSTTAKWKELNGK